MHTPHTPPTLTAESPSAPLRPAPERRRKLLGPRAPSPPPPTSGRHNEAISHAKRAVSLTEGSSLASADLSLTATAYFNLAQVLEATQAPAHRAEMEQTYAAALSIAQRDLGPNHATTMAIQKKYAGAAAKRRSPAEPDSGGSFLPQLNNSGVNTSYTAQAYDEDPRCRPCCTAEKASIQRVSCRVVLCCVVPCHVMLCRDTSCVVSCVVSCYVVLCCVVLCCVVSCRVVSCRVVSCRVVSCRVVSCRVVSCRVVSCRVVSCRVVSCCVVLCCVVLCCVVLFAVDAGHTRIAGTHARWRAPRPPVQWGCRRRGGRRPGPGPTSSRGPRRCPAAWAPDPPWTPTTPSAP